MAKFWDDIAALTGKKAGITGTKVGRLFTRKELGNYPSLNMKLTDPLGSGELNTKFIGREGRLYSLKNWLEQIERDLKRSANAIMDNNYLVSSKIKDNLKYNLRLRNNARKEIAKLETSFVNEGKTVDQALEQGKQIVLGGHSLHKVLGTAPGEGLRGYDAIREFGRRFIAREYKKIPSKADVDEITDEIASNFSDKGVDIDSLTVKNLQESFEYQKALAKEKIKKKQADYDKKKANYDKLMSPKNLQIAIRHAMKKAEQGETMTPADWSAFNKKLLRGEHEDLPEWTKGWTPTVVKGGKDKSHSIEKLKMADDILKKDSAIYDSGGRLTDEGKQNVINHVEALDDVLNSIDEFNFLGKEREDLLLKLQNKSVDLQDILRNKSDWKGPPKPRFSTGGIANNTLAMLLE